MAMNKTSLTRRELAILEKIISNLGYIAYAQDINKLLEKDYSLQEIRRQISLLSKRGWLVRIKRGVFAVASLESHSFANISPLAVSQILVPESYVSFEFALSHYGLFDQLPSKLTAVTEDRPKKYIFQNLEYEFKKIKSDLYFAYREVEVNGGKANVSELEKVFLDFLYFRIDTYSIDLVLEKLKDGRDDLNLKKLFSYAEKYPVSVQRRLGYLLDLADMSSDKLHETIKSRRDFSRLTNASDIFNAKWRIYHEDRFAF
jgi:predicted transcriptional regulator of viral defense system